jgi:hypothetical protein
VANRLTGFVMPGLVPGIDVFVAYRSKGVDGRNKRGDDAL